MRSGPSGACPAGGAGSGVGVAASGDGVIRLVINGEARTLDAPQSVGAYLAALGLDWRYIAVARNGEVVERGAFDSVRLEDGDRVEIVRPVGGG